MKVYIEYVVLDNFVIDYLLILLARKSLRLERGKFFLFLSAAVGTTAAVVLPLFQLSAGASYIVKILLGGLIVLISGKFNTFREYFVCYNLFLFYTFCFCGAVMAAFCFFGIDYSAKDFLYEADISVGFILLVAVSAYIALSKVIKAIYKKRDYGGYVINCEVFIGGVKFPMKGFMDSGNRLFSKKDGMPVILCSPAAARKMRNAGVFAGKRGEIFIFSTAAGKNIMQVYKTDKLQIYNGDKVNTIYNVMIGLSPENFSGEGEYELILSPALY